MGVGLYYRAANTVPPDVVQAILAEAKTVNPGQPWVLCEPIHFFGLDGNDLVGGSKLNLMPHPEELDELRDNPPERDDLQALLHALADWSTRFGVTWELDIDGTPLGAIEPGDGPGSLAGVFEGMAELAGFDPTADLADDPAGDRPPDDPPTGPRLYRG